MVHITRQRRAKEAGVDTMRCGRRLSGLFVAFAAMLARVAGNGGGSGGFRPKNRYRGSGGAISDLTPAPVGVDLGARSAARR